MARIPQPERELTVRETMPHMFAEPDHAPEISTQHAYEAVRDDPWLGSEDEPVTAQRLVTEIHTGPRDRCTWPSHARWAVEKFGKSRDDRHTD